MKLQFLRTVILSCLLLGVFAFPSIAKLIIQPSLTLEEEYNDNIHLTDDNEVEDWITRISPGISVTLENRIADLSLDYSYRFTIYRDNSHLDSNDFEGGQRANLATTFFEGRPFTLGVRGSISRETIDESENSSPENELVNKSTVYDLSVNPQYRLRIGGSSSLVFGYIYDRTDHEDPRGTDSEAHSGRLSLVKQLSTNTEMSANYTYKKYLSDDDANYDQQSYTLGFNQQLGPRTTIGLEGGFSTIEYENEQGDEDTVNWQVDISYRLSAPITLSLVFTQDFSNVATGELTKSRDASFGVGYSRESLSASAELFWNQADYVLVAREDKSYGSRFRLSVPLSSALTTNFDAEYEKSEYDDVIDKEVNHYSLGFSLGYNFSRFVTSLSYRYRLNDSDAVNDDYTNNTVILSVSLRF